MANRTTPYSLPHEKLLAYQVACELLVVIAQTKFRDAGIRDQALRAAKSACLNIAEANGRYSPADRKRVFAIARGEVTEAGAAVHVAALAGECAAERADLARSLSAKAGLLLTGLIR